MNSNEILIRKGRKPKAKNEEEMLQQEEEKAASKLREAQNRNAAKRAKRLPKLNMGPVLGNAAKQEADQPKKRTKNKDQKTQKSKSNLKSSNDTSINRPTQSVTTECIHLTTNSHYDLTTKHTDSTNNYDLTTENMLDLTFEPKENSNIQKLREHLIEQIVASELEANKAIFGSASLLHEKKKRKSEEKDLDLLWTNAEAVAFKAFELHHSCKEFSCTNCNAAKDEIIKCLDCNVIFCGECDTKIHLQNPFHHRIFYSKTKPGKQLLPSEFVDHQGHIVDLCILLPMRSPKCSKCDALMTQKASSALHAVITPKGRFNLNRTIFCCNSCAIEQVAELGDFIVSGYFPGSPVSTKYLFSFELLRLWRHLKYLTPGTSEYKFLETIMAVSADLGRRGTINKNLFNKASKLYEYFNHILDENVTGKKKANCRACTDKTGTPRPLGLHCDGCHKCVRRYSDKKKPGKAWFEDKLIVSNEFSKKVRDEINRVRPPGKTTINSKCGNSQFLAAREVSSKYKNLEGTGIVMASCGHDIVHTAVEMREGETFRDTFTAHIKCRDLNAQFMISDVICTYWDFAKSIGSLLPQYRYLTENMRPFLSYVHGQAHGWYCQVLNFGHWKEGACMLLGEETERVFSIFGPYQNSTKFMNAGNWVDFFTCAGFYINERKEWNLPRIITIRMFKAVAGLEFYTARLKVLLESKRLTEEDLPSIQAELTAEAIDYKRNSKGKNASDLSKLQNELEWLHFEWINVKDRVATVAEGCKWRTKLRRKLGTLYSSAGKKISEINKINTILAESSACEGPSSKNDEVHLRNEPITIKNFEEGIFPWEPASQRSYKEKFGLVDCWHKRNRNKEQIELSFVEMSQFITSVNSSLNSLAHEVSALKDKIPSDEIVRAHVFLKAEEMRRLEHLRQVALSYAVYYRDDMVSDEALKFIDDEDDEHMQDSEDDLQDDQV